MMTHPRPYLLGIDSGSTMCKAVLMDSADSTGVVALLETLAIDAGWNPKQSALSAMEQLLLRRGLSRDDVWVTATGYGREAIDFADAGVTEITCHALGGLHLDPSIQGIVDIGGQDSKIIQLADGRIENFIMNDKCSAGTGRFLSMSCAKLGIPQEDIDAFASRERYVTINSMCTVFAESEIISLLSMQKDRSEILTGVLRSVATKIKQMSGKFTFATNAPWLMTGGLSRSRLLVEIIAEIVGIDLKTHEHALFAGAIGACIAGRKKQF